LSVVLRRLCEAVALSGGLLFVALMLITLWGIVGRELAALAAGLGLPLGVGPLSGEFELVEMGTAIGVFAALPYCQLEGGNVAVELFTERAGRRAKDLLGASGDLLLAAAAVLLARQLWLGMQDLRSYGETTMVLRLPAWWGYPPALVALALLCLVCLVTAARHLRQAFAADAP
jgi:TRAP-type C4-dicarboxylate transport system permease small subunit